MAASKVLIVDAFVMRQNISLLSLLCISVCYVHYIKIMDEKSRRMPPLRDLFIYFYFIETNALTLRAHNHIIFLCWEGSI